jgi:glucose-1-phosphate cytidylyltransferase
MKTVILAGGLGTRLSEETALRPKPMVEIGGRPILWHIMQIYSLQGFNEFIVCLGYKGHMIKEYFLNYSTYNADLTVDLREGKVTVHRSVSEPWTIRLVDTGEATMTGGRLKRLEPLLAGETFFCTYGDGVGNIDLKALREVHAREGRIATVTATVPPGRFGALKIDGARVANFMEKPADSEGWVNAGFFVFDARVFGYIAGDLVSLEEEPLRKLASDGQLSAYTHRGFWQPMDTLREKRKLEDIYAAGSPPWFAVPKAS